MTQVAHSHHPTLSAPLSLGLIRRRPVATYFVLAFALTWGGVLLAVGGPAAIPATSEQALRLFPIVFAAMCLGPSVAGLLMTGLVDGKAGFRELWSRLVRWRVGAGWYAVALLAAPLLVTALLLAMSVVSPQFLPVIFSTEDKASLLLIGLATGLAAGIFEEVGWTGFAIPRLLRTHRVLATGLVVGLLWAGWHLLVYVWGSGDAAGSFSLALFLPELIFLVGVLPVFRVLLVGMYDRTGSLLLAMLMHASLASSVPMILTPLATGAPRVAYYLVLTTVLWGVVAAVAVANRRQPARAPLPRPVV